MYDASWRYDANDDLKKSNLSLKPESFPVMRMVPFSRGYVGALVDAGVTSGTYETTFSPDAIVTREELAPSLIWAATRLRLKSLS